MEYMKKLLNITILGLCIMLSLSGCSDQRAPEKSDEISSYVPGDSVKFEFEIQNGDSNFAKRAHFEQVLKGRAFPSNYRDSSSK